MENQKIKEYQKTSSFTKIAKNPGKKDTKLAGN